MPRRGPHHANITWTPHIRIAWGGTLGIGKEIWTNSIKFLPAVPGAQCTPAEALAAAEGMWGSTTPGFGRWMAGGATSFIGEDATLTWLKINNILATGLQASQATNVFDTGAPWTGANANHVPLYQTYAITLRTAVKRGRAHSGRIFPPVVQPPITDGSGMCSAASATAMAAAFELLLSDMEAAMIAAGIPGGFAVLSPGDTVKGTVPLHNGITGVVVDRVPDVQHRRTNRLPRSEGTPAAFAGGAV